MTLPFVITIINPSTRSVPMRNRTKRQALSLAVVFWLLFLPVLSWAFCVPEITPSTPNNQLLDNGDREVAPEI